MEDGYLLILEFVSQGRLTVDEAVALIAALRRPAAGAGRAKTGLAALQIKICLT